jgi:hypothetical protein
MHFTELHPVGLTLFHVEIRTDVDDECKGYFSWKRTSNLHILLTLYIYALWLVLDCTLIISLNTDNWLVSTISVVAEICWDVTLCRWVSSFRSFQGTFCLHFQESCSLIWTIWYNSWRFHGDRNQWNFLGQTAASRCESFPFRELTLSKPSGCAGCWLLNHQHTLKIGTESVPEKETFTSWRGCLPEKISGNKCLLVEDAEGTTNFRILGSRTRNDTVSPSSRSLPSSGCAFNVRCERNLSINSS